MGSYMTASIFKKINGISVFSSNPEKLFYELHQAKNSPEKTKNVLEKYKLIHNGFPLINPIFWEFRGDNYQTNTGVPGLYDLLPNLHRSFKYYLPEVFLLISSPSDFEEKEEAFGRSVLKASIALDIVNNFLNQVDPSLLKGSQFEKEWFDKKEDTTFSSEFGLETLFANLSFDDSDLLYINLSDIFTDYDNPDIKKEREIIRKKRDEFISKYKFNPSHW